MKIIMKIKKKLMKMKKMKNKKIINLLYYQKKQWKNGKKYYVKTLKI